MILFRCNCGKKLVEQEVVTIPNIRCGDCKTMYTWYNNWYREFEYAEIVTGSKKEVNECSGIGLTYRRKWRSV